GRRQLLVDRWHEGRAPPTDGPHAVDGPGPGPGDHPGLRRATGGVVAGRTLPRLPEDVLEHVGGVAAVADDPEDQRVDERRVAVVETTEGLAVTGGHPPDQVLPRGHH